MNSALETHGLEERCSLEWRPLKSDYRKQNVATRHTILTFFIHSCFRYKHKQNFLSELRASSADLCNRNLLFLDAVVVSMPSVRTVSVRWTINSFFFHKKIKCFMGRKHMYLYWKIKALSQKTILSETSAQVNT